MQFFQMAQSPSATPATVPPYRREGESFVDCYNRCLSERGVESRLTSSLLVACGFGALLTGLPTGPIAEIGLLPVLLGSCIALASGVDIGITIECAGRCANIPPELRPVDIVIEFERSAADPTTRFTPAIVGSNRDPRPQTFRYEPD